MNIREKITKIFGKLLNKERIEDIKYFVRIGFILLIIASVTATLLAFVNALTKERIAENELAVMQEAVGKIFDGSDEIKLVDIEIKEPVVAVYEVYKGEYFMGYGVQVAPVGFKEEIGMIVGLEENGRCLGVEIISISDTPGVGTKVKESSFLEGFIGLDKTDVDSAELISGATVSSSAVKAGVKAALEVTIPSEGGVAE